MFKFQSAILAKVVLFQVVTCFLCISEKVKRNFVTFRRPVTVWGSWSCVSQHKKKPKKQKPPNPNKLENNWNITSTILTSSTNVRVRFHQISWSVVCVLNTSAVNKPETQWKRNHENQNHRSVGFSLYLLKTWCYSKQTPNPALMVLYIMRKENSLGFSIRYQVWVMPLVP